MNSLYLESVLLGCGYAFSTPCPTSFPWEYLAQPLQEFHPGSIFPAQVWESHPGGQDLARDDISDQITCSAEISLAREPREQPTDTASNAVSKQNLCRVYKMTLAASQITK